MDDPIKDGNAIVAASATDVEQLSNEYRRAFRQSVQEALQYVFRMSEEDASKRLKAYFEASGDLSLFAYHRHPLQIATDLSPAAERDLEPEEQRRYLGFASAKKDSFGLPRRTTAGRGQDPELKMAW